MITEIFGERLKYWREKRGLSLGQLYMASGVTATTLSKYEHGRQFPTLKTVECLLDALKISISEFFGEENPNG